MGKIKHNHLGYCLWETGRASTLGGLRDPQIYCMSVNVYCMCHTDFSVNPLLKNLHLEKRIFKATLEKEYKFPNLLNEIYSKQVQLIFSEVCMALQIVCTLLVTGRSWKTFHEASIHQKLHAFYHETGVDCYFFYWASACKRNWFLRDNPRFCNEKGGLKLFSKMANL